MKTNPTTFRIDYISPEITMISLTTGDVLIGLSKQSLESASSEELKGEYTYTY